MADQLRGGGVVPDLNLPPPETGDQAPSPAAEVDRISSLPEKARQRILGFLPLKAATMLGMVSRSWGRLVCKPQWPCDSILGSTSAPRRWGRAATASGRTSAPTKSRRCWLTSCATAAAAGARATASSASSSRSRTPRRAPPTSTPSSTTPPTATWSTSTSSTRGGGPDHRLLRFLLKVDDAQTRPADFHSLLAYAADCDVEDILVTAGLEPPPVSFNFQWAFRRLLRLALFGVGVTEVHRRPLHQVRSIRTLEIISIRSSILGDLDLQRVLRLCPRLRSLTLRNCHFLTCVDVTAASRSLVMLTVAECPTVDQISVSTALNLQTFKYIGDLLRSVALPTTCFRDLRICFTKPTMIHPVRLHNWLEALPNLFHLVSLSICGNALKIICRLIDMENFQFLVADKFCNLLVTELQLVVLHRMDTEVLSHIYGFLWICRCSRMRNLFVQLPKATTDYSFKDAIKVELAKAPRMSGIESLVKVKITNFKWQYNEIELVHFLFRKARSLQKLILVAPKGTNPQRDQSGNAIYTDLNLLCLEKPPENVEVQVLSEFSDRSFVLINRHQFIEISF